MNQIATRPAQAEQRTLTVRQQIDQLKPEFAKTLPKNIEPDAFVRTVHTAMQLNPDLTNVSPRSLFAACMKAASDGLILDGREAALVIRNVKIEAKGKHGATADKWEKQAIYQPMVQGLMKLARNSGEISNIISHVVYTNDKFTYVLGDDERIEHAPAPLDQDQGAAIAVYAIVKLKDGTVQREVMRKKAVLNIAAQGQNAYQYDPDSGKNFAEWWRKTAIRRIAKFIPRSSDAVGKFVSAVEQIDSDFDFAEQDNQPAKTGLLAPKKRGGAAAALKDVTPKKAAQAKPQPEPERTEDGEDYDRETGEIMDYDGPDQRQGDDI